MSTRFQVFQVSDGQWNSSGGQFVSGHCVDILTCLFARFCCTGTTWLCVSPTLCTGSRYAVRSSSATFVLFGVHWFMADAIWVFIMEIDGQIENVLLFFSAVISNHTQAEDSRWPHWWQLVLFYYSHIVTKYAKWCVFFFLFILYFYLFGEEFQFGWCRIAGVQHVNVPYAGFSWIRSVWLNTSIFLWYDTNSFGAVITLSRRFPLVYCSDSVQFSVP